MHLSEAKKIHAVASAVCRMQHGECETLHVRGQLNSLIQSTGIDGVSEEKPVSVTLNISRIAGILDSVIGGAAPPTPVAPPSPFPPPVTPPSPPGIPPGPGPAPPPEFNFTVPLINFQPPPPISISGNKIVDSSGAEVKFNVSPFAQLFSDHLS